MTERNENGRPIGVPFSRVYLESGAPKADSQRLRERLASYYDANLDDIDTPIVKILQQELGVPVPSGIGGYMVPEFFRRASLPDFLSTITYVVHALEIAKRMGRGYHDYDGSIKKWIKFVERAMREENVAYTVDSRGGVHFYVDKEFQRSRAAAVAVLGNSRYGAVLNQLNASHEALDKVPPATKDALQRIFESVETLFKLVCKDRGPSRLGSSEVERFLKPLLPQLYATGTDDGNVANQIAASLGNWANAIQAYRHGKEEEIREDPPLDLAIALVSEGATFLRWLAAIDARLNP